MTSTPPSHHRFWGRRTVAVSSASDIGERNNNNVDEISSIVEDSPEDNSQRRTLSRSYLSASSLANSKRRLWLRLPIARRSRASSVPTLPSSSVARPSLGVRSSSVSSLRFSLRRSSGNTNETGRRKSMSRGSRVIDSQGNCEQALATTNAKFNKSCSFGADTPKSTFDPQVLSNFLEKQCPVDLLPKILAYAGPKKALALSRCNRHWKSVLDREATWKSLCEELYKWESGDPVPESWKEYYCLNPCVPVDYTSVSQALSLASDWLLPSRSNAQNYPALPQTRSIRILIRPGKHKVMECMNIQAKAGIKVVIEAQKLPTNTFKCPIRPIPIQQAADESESPNQRSSRLKRRNSSSLPRRRPFWRRQSSTSDVVAYSDEQSDLEFDWPEPATTSNRVTLTMNTRLANEPVLRVRSGIVILKDISIEHYCNGMDIWSGNAAVHVQPSEDDDFQPTAILERVQISSRSGRGIVAIDGGRLKMIRSKVHRCAATGVYVGGSGSSATMEQTDVTANGVGSLSRRGIAPGHSGVYLEQGQAKILDCNISHNTLTGISAVSSENSILHLEHSDLIANGTCQLEVPPIGTVARRQSIINGNTLAVTGSIRPRSDFD